MGLKLFVCLVAIVTAAEMGSDGPASLQFEIFTKKYNKSYGPNEEDARFAMFQRSLERIASKNAAYPPGKEPFGVTKFSDLSPDEFSAVYLMKTTPQHDREARTASEFSVDPPAAFDWRSHRPTVLTAVYDQGNCGSCWAFSTMENIESVWAIANHSLQALSAQQLVSCDHASHGCNGGNPPNAYKYVLKHGGMESDETYPYEGENSPCDARGPVVAKITGFEYITRSHNETAMLNYLYAKNPLSVCVYAETWQDYNQGVLTSDCSGRMDHCVIVTGYGSDTSTPYWAVRNSWGADWGMNGYILIERNINLCRIGDEVTSAYIDSEN